MKKKKSKIKMDLSNDVFDLGVTLALAPLNFILRKLSYYPAMVVSIVSIFTWCMPVIIGFSLVSNTIFVIEILIKLLRK